MVNHQIAVVVSQGLVNVRQALADMFALVFVVILVNVVAIILVTRYVIVLVLAVIVQILQLVRAVPFQQLVAVAWVLLKFVVCMDLVTHVIVLTIAQIV